MHVCVCRAQPGKNCRWPRSAQQSMQQKYENKTTKKMKSNRNIFVWNGLKTKQSESKQKQAHTTKRNVCVMYGKYVHCTHTHAAQALAVVHMDMFYSGREYINISFSVCCAPFTTCYFARLPGL